MAEDGDKSAQKAKLAQAMAVVSFTKTIDQAREKKGGSGRRGGRGREGEGGRFKNRGCYRKFALTTLVVLTAGERQGLDDIATH